MLKIPDKLGVLLIGGGGREHALAAKLRESKRLRALYATHRENPGIAALSQAVDAPYSMQELYRLHQFARKSGIDLIVVGPEDPLAEGFVDKYRHLCAQAGDKPPAIFGPTAEGARLEADKAWCKRLMRAASVPTAEARVFTDAHEAADYLRSRESSHVVKASGLARGKGVFVPESLDEALRAVDRIMVQREFGEAGREVVIEERLKGKEVSVFALTDGRSIYVLDSAQDHKRLGEGDTGPNTGGMGAYSPTTLIDARIMSTIEREVLVPIVDALRREEIEYRGVLYAGLMLTPAGPKVLEFNARFGDPECQVLMPRLRADLIEVLYATATGRLEEADLSWDSRHSCCVVLASDGYPDKPRKGQVIEGIEDAEKVPGVRVYHAGTVRDKEGRIVVNGGRVLNVVGLGETLAAAREAALRACELIRFDGKVYRKDIGAGA